MYSYLKVCSGNPALAVCMKIVCLFNIEFSGFSDKELVQKNEDLVATPLGLCFFSCFFPHFGTIMKETRMLI